MKKIRTAVVGAGKMGTIHAKVSDQLDDCELVAVVDTDMARVGTLAKAYGCASLGDCP